MNIAPLSLNSQIVNRGDSPTATAARSAGVPHADGAAESSSSASGAPASPTMTFSTDLRIDNQHQVYYEVVDDQTGSELLEIPPAALRAISENLNVPLEGDQATPILNVKS